MAQAAAIAEPSGTGAGRHRFVARTCYAFVALAILAFGASVAGERLGKAIVLAGHSDDPTLREIVLGNNVLEVPANAIRFAAQRTGGDVDRLDLYLLWPQMEGYSDDARDAFNHARGAPRILFLTLEPRAMSADMSGRLEPIYRALVEDAAQPGPGAVMLHAFRAESGYLNEALAIAGDAAGEPFVARCLAGEAATLSLAPCQRDVHVGDELSLTYRFPAHLLGEWKALDRAVRQWAAAHIRTDRSDAQSRSTSRIAIEKL